MHGETFYELRCAMRLWAPAAILQFRRYTAVRLLSLWNNYTAQSLCRQVPKPSYQNSWTIGTKTHIYHTWGNPEKSWICKLDHYIRSISQELLNLLFIFKSRVIRELVYSIKESFAEKNWKRKNNAAKPNLMKNKHSVFCCFSDPYFEDIRPDLTHA